MDMRRVLLAVLFASTVLSRGPAAAQSPQLFEFRAGFWGNLHHFLYVLGRAQNRAPDRARQGGGGGAAGFGGPPLDCEGLAARSDAEQALWKDAVSFYAAGVSKKEAVFDDELVRIT